MLHEALVIAATFAAVQPGSPMGDAKGETTKGVRQEVGDISGYYACKGVEVGGKAYSGVCVIMKKNEVYLVQWMVGGGSTFSGVGIRQGETLSASWALPGERGLVRGVNVYRIEPGPRLTGRWASVPGPGVLQNETLTFLKKIEAEE